MAEDVTVAEVADWAVGLDEVLGRIGRRFARPEWSTDLVLPPCSQERYGDEESPVGGRDAAKRPQRYPH
jgi:hypothetical protein